MDGGKGNIKARGFLEKADAKKRKESFIPTINTLTRALKNQS